MQSTSKNTNEILHGHLVAAIVNFDIFTVHVDWIISAAVDRTGARVACIACHIIGYHQNDVTARHRERSDKGRSEGG